MSDWVHNLVDLEIILVCIGLVVFVVSYMAFFNWRKTPAGRSLLFFVLSLLSLVSVSMIRVFLGVDHPFFSVARGLVYTALLITTWHMVHVLWTSYHRNAELAFPPGPPVSKKSKEGSV